MRDLWRAIVSSGLGLLAVGIVVRLTYVVAVYQVLPKGVCSVQWVGLLILVLWVLSGLLGWLGVLWMAWRATPPSWSYTAPWVASGVLWGFVLPSFVDIGSLLLLAGLVMAMAAWLLQPRSHRWAGLRRALTLALLCMAVVWLLGWFVLTKIPWVPC